MASKLTKVERRLEPVLTSGLHYEYSQTPANFFAQAESERRTTNCKIAGHLSLQALYGLRLPVSMQLAEAFFDPDKPQSTFRAVAPTEDMIAGDWLLLGESSRIHPATVRPVLDATRNMLNWDEFAINHLAVYAGRLGRSQIVLHAAPQKDTELTELSTLLADARTSQIYGVRRLLGVRPELLAA